MSDLHDCNQCKFTDGSEVSKRVCAECFDKTSWEPKPTVYTVDIDLDVQTRINLNPCPLPRIGSKEWGWDSKDDTTALGNEFIRFESKLAKNYVIAKVETCVVYKILKPGSSCRIGFDLSLRDAKTLVESRARRDWRKANRHG